MVVSEEAMMVMTGTLHHQGLQIDSISIGKFSTTEVILF